MQELSPHRESSNLAKAHVPQVTQTQIIMYENLPQMFATTLKLSQLTNVVALWLIGNVLHFLLMTSTLGSRPFIFHAYSTFLMVFEYTTGE